MKCYSTIIVNLCIYLKKYFLPVLKYKSLWMREKKVVKRFEQGTLYEQAFQSNGSILK